MVFAGNRRIALECLQLLVKSGLVPKVLLVPDGDSSEYAEEMAQLVPNADVLVGKEFGSFEGMAKIGDVNPDYLLMVHFPLIVPLEVLSLMKVGSLNLHPAYLPKNRGWHTPTWSILEETQAGATLHWVDEGLDTGPIACQKEVPVFQEDTAHGLYQRILRAELRLFEECIPMILKDELPRKPQKGSATTHKKDDLHEVQSLEDLGVNTVKKVVDRLRALTTSECKEAAYFDHEGSRYYVRVDISREPKT